jgi:hypothetical protein
MHGLTAAPSRLSGRAHPHSACAPAPRASRRSRAARCSAAASAPPPGGEGAAAAAARRLQQQLGDDTAARRAAAAAADEDFEVDSYPHPVTDDPVIIPAPVSASEVLSSAHPEAGAPQGWSDDAPPSVTASLSLVPRGAQQALGRHRSDDPVTGFFVKCKLAWQLFFPPTPKVR